MEKINFIRIDLPEFKKLKLTEKLTFSNLNKRSESYKIGKTGILLKAVVRKVEKTKEEILSEYSSKVIEYETSKQKHLLPIPRREKYKTEFVKWTIVKYTGDLKINYSDDKRKFEATLRFVDGRMIGKFDENKDIKWIYPHPSRKKTKKLAKLKPLKDFITILKNKKPFVKVIFFNKRAKKEIEEILKNDKIDYRWEKNE